MFTKQHLQKKRMLKPTKQNTTTATVKNISVDGVICGGGGGGGGGSRISELSALILKKIDIVLGRLHGWMRFFLRTGNWCVILLSFSLHFLFFLSLILIFLFILKRVVSYK